MPKFRLSEYLLLWIAFVFAGPALAYSAETTTAGRGDNPDTLVYNNGDRLQGKLVSNDGTSIVFRSANFGEVTVPCTQAKVEATSKIVEAQDVTKHWQGRIAFAGEIVHDTVSRRTNVIEAKVARKWTADELGFNSRYEFDNAQGQTSTDVLKASADWRHNLSKRWFTIYRPVFELNHSSEYQGLPADYFLAQQEVGLGRILYGGPSFKLRVGFSELFYDVWLLKNKSHFGKIAPAGFIENETKLPGRTTFSTRMVRYYRTSGTQGGWEGQAELSKKLTDTLTIALHYEIRHHDPDIRVTDYESLRLMLGLDF